MISRTLKTAAACCATAAAAAGLAAAGSAAPVAHAAKNCAIGSGRQFGYTYLTALSESGTTCAAATSLAKAHGHQRGWRCTTKKLATSPTQYQASETCTSGGRKVVWNFSQNT
jgi:hypothetical protein